MRLYDLHNLWECGAVFVDFCLWILSVFWIYLFISKQFTLKIIRTVLILIIEIEFKNWKLYQLGSFLSVSIELTIFWLVVVFLPSLTVPKLLSTQLCTVWSLKWNDKQLFMVSEELNRSSNYDSHVQARDIYCLHLQGVHKVLRRLSN